MSGYQTYSLRPSENSIVEGSGEFYNGSFHSLSDLLIIGIRGLVNAVVPPVFRDYFPSIATPIFFVPKRNAILLPPFSICYGFLEGNQVFSRDFYNMVLSGRIPNNFVSGIGEVYGGKIIESEEGIQDLARRDIGVSNTEIFSESSVFGEKIESNTIYLSGFRGLECVVNAIRPISGAVLWSELDSSGSIINHYTLPEDHRFREAFLNQ